MSLPNLSDENQSVNRPTIGIEPIKIIVGIVRGNRVEAGSDLSGHLVGQRYSDRHLGLALQHPRQPAAFRNRSSSKPGQSRHCPNYQKASDILRCISIGRLRPRPVNSPSGKCCAVDEWPISALRGGAESDASAAFLVPRARAAKKSNSQYGLFAVFQVFLINVSFRVICRR